MKKVLFIAYHFPPLAGGGTFRSLKFVKYLPEFGWLPTVITTNTKTYWAYDDSLSEEIPEDVKIIRAGEFDPFYLQIILSKIGLGRLYHKIKDHFFIPDEKIGWIPFAYRKAVMELKKEKYHLIFSTSPTPCAHILANKLKKRFELPWVIDYRDLWTLNPEYRYKKSARFKKEFNLERMINSRSDKIVSVTKGNIKVLRKCFQIERKKISLIYNGFDDEVSLQSKGKDTNGELFSITYTGTFYGDRNPETFLNALSMFCYETPECLEYLRIRFYGRSDFNILQKAETLGLKKVIRYCEYISKKQLDPIYHESKVLLLIIPENEGYVLTSKIFDYLCYSKPILAIIPDGEAKEILQKANLGFFADPSSPEDIKKQVLHLYHLWKTGQLRVDPNTEYIRQFHRRNLTKQLAEVFNSLT